jgi:plasmid stabilization system protein ParE
VKSKRVERTVSYREDLDTIEAHIVIDSPRAALEMWMLIDELVDQLADPNFPRRKGRVPGTLELVAHQNYIVILIEDDTTVTAINVVHSRQRWPK